MVGASIRHTVLFAFGLLAATLANGQDVCRDINQIVAAAPGKFRSLQGARDGDFYVATKVLPNANECLVYHDDGHDSYDCEWEYDDAAALDQAYESFAASVGACLKPLRTKNRTSDRVVKRVTYVLIDDDNYSVEVDVAHRKSRSGREFLQLSVNRFTFD